ncbi:MAG TPA: HPr family phosphocarrier protein [Spirochaetia bacterium]|nr:HPr family phosphocarrier protein [Spirochaetia bacterium]
MVERIVTIRNRAGMHARPAALLVKTASEFESRIYIEKDSERVNGKSIMGVITLGATYNTPLKIIADGPDEALALDAIEKLFENRFEEE